MAEEVKNDDQQKKLSKWADALVLGTIAAGAVSFTAARVNFPVAAVFCCGLGGIALSRSVLEKKWLYAVVAALVMGVVAFGAINARNDMDRSARQMQRALGE